LTATKVPLKVAVTSPLDSIVPSTETFEPSTFTALAFRRSWPCTGVGLRNLIEYSAVTVPGGRVSPPASISE